MTDLILRPYQVEAVKAFLASGHATIKAAPGAGKTVIAIAIARALRESSPVICTLVITPTVDLVRQWEGFFEKYGFDSAEYRVVTYALAARRVDQPEFWGGFNFIVADEVHHLAEGPVFMYILMPIIDAPYALGLSATPPTDPENAALRVLPVVYEYTLDEAREQGYAAPVEVRPVGIQLTDEERERYNELSVLIRAAVNRAGGNLGRAATIPVATRTDPETGKNVNVYGGQLMTERKQLVAGAEAKFEKLEELVYGILGLTDQVPPNGNGEPPTRLFVWSEFVNALEKAKETLNRNGFIAELVTGQTPKAERRRLLTEAWGRDFPVLLIARIGEEGLDYPEVDTGIIIAGAKTLRQNIQRVGRLLRLNPSLRGKVAKLYILFASNTIEERLIEIADTLT